MEEEQTILFDNIRFKVNVFNKLEKLYIDLKSSNPLKQYSNIIKNLNDLKTLNKDCRLKELKDTILIDFMETINDCFIEGDYEINKEEDSNKIYIIFNPNDPKYKFKIEFKEIELVNNNLSYENLDQETKNLIDEKALIIGIDFGTTNSSAAVLIGDKIVVIPNSFGSRLTPSFVMFLSENERCVGELAKFFPSRKGKNIIYNCKRLLGKNFNDPTIQEIIRNHEYNFEILQMGEKFVIQLMNEMNESFYPEQIAAMILKKLILDSQNYLSELIGKPIQLENAVITVPAYFNQRQRESIIQSAKIIGLSSIKLINEPTAASLAYAYKYKNFNIIENGNDKKTKTVVIDFGGGTLDITLLEYKNYKDGKYCDIKYSYGNTNIGGENFDLKIMRSALSNNNFNEDNINSNCNLRLKNACEKAKIKLCNSYLNNPKYKVDIKLVEFHESRDLKFTLTKDTFMECCSDLFNNFKNILNNFLTESGLKNKKHEIKEIILIGGATKIPEIENIIKSVFSNGNICPQINKNLNRSEAVAMGAAVRGAILSNLSSVNFIKFFDVNNFPYGIKIIGNEMSIIIKRSCPIPYGKEQQYVTTRDYQTKALIEVYEGEKINVNENLRLKSFEISNLPSLPKGKAEIKVKIEINDDSILNVTATDLTDSKNKKNLIIKNIFWFDDEILQKFKEKERQMINLDEQYYLEKNDMKIDNMIEEDKKLYKKNKCLEIYKNFKKEIINLKENINVINEEEEEENNNNQNNQIIFNYYKSLLEIYGQINEYLLKVNDIETKKIFLSFISYYFNLINEFLDYSINEIDEQFLNPLKKNICEIVNQINFNDSEITFSLLENFFGNNNFYQSCLEVLVNKYLGILKEFELNIKRKKENCGDIYEMRNIKWKCGGYFEKISSYYKITKKLSDEITNNNEEMIAIKNYINDYHLFLKVQNYICDRHVFNNWSLDISDFIADYKNSSLFVYEDYLYLILQIKNTPIFYEKIKHSIEEDKPSCFKNQLNIFRTKLRNEKGEEYKKTLQKMLRFICCFYPPNEKYIDKDYDNNIKEEYLNRLISDYDFYKRSVSEEKLEIFNEIILLLNFVKNK